MYAHQQKQVNVSKMNCYNDWYNSIKYVLIFIVTLPKSSRSNALNCDQNEDLFRYKHKP